MNIWEQIENCKSELTPKEREIYDLVYQDPYSFTTLSATEIASRYNVAQSTISRFCQKAGFSGFGDFRLSMAMSNSSQVLQTGSASQNSEGAYDFIQAFCHMAQLTGQAMAANRIQPLAKRIIHATHIYTSGYGASHVAADSLAFQLTCSGIPASNIMPSREEETLHIIRSTDIVILFSTANPSHRNFLLLTSDIAPEMRPYLVLVSSTNKHPLRHRVSQVVTLPYPSESGYITSFQLNVPQYIFSCLLTEQCVRLLLEQDAGASQMPTAE